MAELLREALWGQYGAALDMIEEALVACPDEQWDTPGEHPRFWYVLYHTLFFLDFYLSDSGETFAPPAPFPLSELDPAGVLPDRVYDRHELHSYLRHGRRKCRALIESLTDERARASCALGSITGSRLELLLYNLRHVQHHGGQLYLLLRQRTDSAPGWVSRARGG